VHEHLIRSVSANNLFKFGMGTRLGSTLFLVCCVLLASKQSVAQESDPVPTTRDVIFLSGFQEIWTFITVWTVTVVGSTYFLLSTQTIFIQCSKCKGIWVPFAALIFGVIVGFVHGAPVGTFLHKNLITIL